MAGQGEEPAAGGPHHAVQVSRERVIAPPARFLSCSDDTLLGYFQGLLGEQAADQLAALFSLLEGVTQHEFLALRRRLEADFAVFSAAGQGVQVPLGGPHSAHHRRLQRLSSMEEHERRFLRDFMSAMHSSHYRLLGSMEWEAAQAEAFLFTLPVEVEWSALDKRMLQRFWGDHPEQRASLPDLSDRILIFCRGFEPAKMRGRYLMQKVEMLLSFYLLAPLWACVSRVLQQLGLRAPPPPPIARTPKKSDMTFKRASVAAAAAVRWRRAAQGGVPAEESLTVLHDACTIIERKTMSRHFPTGRSVLSRFFDVIELQEACIRDVVVLFRRKVSKDRQAQPGEKEILRPGGEADTALLARNIQIRQFTGIPLADLEMVMPEKKVFVPGSVFVQLVVAAVVALVGLLATFWQANMDWKVWGSALMLLGSRASQVYFQASSERNEIEREMNKLLFERTVASQEAVLHTLTDEMCRQHIRECFLCYCCLLHAGKDMKDEDLDVRCERLLRKNFELRLDFTAEAAIPPLCEWGLVQRLPDGRLRAQPLQAALVALDSVWDSAFSFEGPAADDQARVGSSPASSVPSAAGGGGGADPSPIGAGSESRGGRRARSWLRWPSAEHRKSFSRHSPLTRATSPTSRRAPSPAFEPRSCAGTPAAAGGPSSSTASQQSADFLLKAVLEGHELMALEGASSDSISNIAATASPLEAEQQVDELAEQLPPPPLATLAGLPRAAGAAGAEGAKLEGTAGVCSSHAAATSSVGEGQQQPCGDAVSIECMGHEEPEAVESGAAEAAGSEPGAAEAQPPASGPAFSSPTRPVVRLPLAASRSSSSSSLEAGPILLHVPWSSSPGAATLLRSPSAGSARISTQQLRHLESLRRQRAQQEAEALECLPSSLRLRMCAEAEAQQQPRGELRTGLKSAKRHAQANDGDAEACHTTSRRSVMSGRWLGGGRRVGSAGVLGSRVRSARGRHPSP